MKRKQKLLLIADVDDLGKGGEIVAVRPGYARNFLLPQKKAVIATKNTLRMQEKLKKERALRAEVEKKESEELSAKVEGTTFSINVKVDPEGKMYGSVSPKDIVDLLAKEGYEIDKRSVQLKQPIKETGAFQIHLKLKEEVTCSFHLKVVPEVEEGQKG